jgi:hypothetical protein
MSSVLERRYRLLLSAYPPEYIDSNEEEIIGTLLDGAKPGQLRPTFAEASTLLISGLRLRVRMSIDGWRPVRNWSDSVRLAALLLLASVLSDRLASGSDVVPLIASAFVACSIVAVVMGRQRLGALLALLALLALVVSAITTPVSQASASMPAQRWELWLLGLPPAWLYDSSSLFTVAFALATASIRSGPRRPWPWWLAAIAIAVPFLYRLFWLGASDGYDVPLSIFELVLPVAAFSVAALLLHDPRPAIAATIYAALHLVVPLTVELELRAIDSRSWTLTLALTAAALSVGMASSRRQVEDLALPHI